MHGMNVQVQIQPGKIEEAASLLREEIMPKGGRESFW